MPGHNELISWIPSSMIVGGCAKLINSSCSLSSRIDFQILKKERMRKKMEMTMMLMLMVLSVAVVAVVSSSSSQSGQHEPRQPQQQQQQQHYSRYTRYPAYPAYCSDPHAMATRTIPPLPPVSPVTSTTTTRLQHVTVIVRHGARTPLQPNACWPDHWSAPDGIWDCTLTTRWATRPAPLVGTRKNHTAITTGGTKNEGGYGQFVLEKVYDAFVDGERSHYTNILNGTCQDGQLLQQGYDQQVQNGHFLRHAYIEQPDPRLQLWTASALVQNTSSRYFLDPYVRYRSDDDQRTLASGQIVLATLFAPELQVYAQHHPTIPHPIITHHVGDKSQDYLSARHAGRRQCPTQQHAILARAFQSEEYHHFDQAPDSHTMRTLIAQELTPHNGSTTFGGLDCLMTSICTDRALPAVLQDYQPTTAATTTEEATNTTTTQDHYYTQKYGPNRFERLRKYVIHNTTFSSAYNDAELAKLEMGPLWSEILEVKDQHPHQFLSLFSAHDSTIYPLLLSLGGTQVWNVSTDFPPYASMMILEFHDVYDVDEVGVLAPSGEAFRLIYDGQVLTGLIDGCPDDQHLCDISVFNNRVFEFATRKHHDCGVEEGGGGDGINTNDEDDTDEPIFPFVLLPNWMIPQKVVREDLEDHTSKSSNSSFYLLFALWMVAGFILGCLLTLVIVTMWYCCCSCCCYCHRWCRLEQKQRREESQLVSLGTNTNPNNKNEFQSEEFMDEPDVVINSFS